MFVLVGIKPFWPLLCLPNVWNFVRYLLAKGTSIIGLQSWKKIFDSFIVLNNAFSFQCKLSVDTSFVQYIQFSIMHTVLNAHFIFSFQIYKIYFPLLMFWLFLLKSADQYEIDFCLKVSKTKCWAYYFCSVQQIFTLLLKSFDYSARSFDLLRPRLSPDHARLRSIKSK